MPGPVPVDPWSAGLMAAGSVASAALAKPAMTSATSFGTAFDNSGWNVNIGDGASQSTSTDRSQSPVNLGGLLKNPLVLAALAYVAYVYLVKK